MKITWIYKICILSSLFLSSSIHSISFSETIGLLKQALTGGETLPLSELPFLDDISLPGPIKDALSKIELTGPTITTSGESAVLTAGASFFGMPVKVQIRMGLNLGSAARPSFVSRTQDKKPGAQTAAQATAEEQAALQKVGKLVKQETEQVEVVPGSLLAANPENTALQASTVAEQEGTTALSGAKIPTNVLQDMAPQGQVTVPIQDTKQVANETSQVNKSIGKLEPEKEKKAPSNIKAKLSDAAKGALKILKYSIFIGIPKLDFATIDSRLAFLNLIQFSKLAFVITNDDYTDTDWNRTFYSGFNILGTARLTGPLDKVAGTIGTNLTEVALQGVIKEQVFGSFLLAQLPGKLKIGQGLETSGLMLRVQLVQGAVPLAISILTGLDISVPNQSTPLGFRVGLTYLMPTEFVLGGWLEGMWKNPLGLPYFSIGEVGIQAGMDLTTAASSLGILSISRLGMRGKMGFSDKTVEMASSISLSSSSPDIMLYGKFTGGITLEDVITVGATIIEESAKQAGESVSIKDKVKGKLPNLGIKEAEILLAPKDVPLAGRYYSQGVTVGGGVEILGVTGELRVAIQKSKVSGHGFLSAINVGPFTLTGAGKDKKRGTSDDGPIINFFISKDLPFISLFLDARAEFDKKILGGAYGDVHVNLSLAGVDFALKTKLFNEFATNLEVSGQTVKPQDWKVVAQFEQEALTHFADLVQKAIEEIAKSADRNIAQAQNEVNAAKAKLSALNPSRTALDNQISKCKGQSTIKSAPLQAEVQVALDKKIRALQGPELTAQDIKKQIDTLRSQGVSQSQLDLVAQNMWARIARRALEDSRSIIQTFKNNPTLLKGLDATTQAAIQQALAKAGSTKISDITAVVEGQIEWMLSKLRSMGMPEQFVKAVRETVWKNEYWSRYYKAYTDAILRAPAVDAQERALNDYANNIRRMDWVRATGLDAESIDFRIKNFKSLIRQAIMASELLSKKIGANNIDKYIDNRWSALRDDYARKLSK